VWQFVHICEYKSNMWALTPQLKDYACLTVASDVEAFQRYYVMVRHVR